MYFSKETSEAKYKCKLVNRMIKHYLDNLKLETVYLKIISLWLMHYSMSKPTTNFIYTVHCLRAPCQFLEEVSFWVTIYSHTPIFTTQLFLTTLQLMVVYFSFITAVMWNSTNVILKITLQFKEALEELKTKDTSRSTIQQSEITMVSQVPYSL